MSSPLKKGMRPKDTVASTTGGTSHAVHHRVARQSARPVPGRGIAGGRVRLVRPALPLVPAGGAGPLAAGPGPGGGGLRPGERRRPPAGHRPAGDAGTGAAQRLSRTSPGNGRGLPIGPALQTL